MWSSYFNNSSFCDYDIIMMGVILEFMCRRKYTYEYNMDDTSQRRLTWDFYIRTAMNKETAIFRILSKKIIKISKK